MKNVNLLEIKQMAEKAKSKLKQIAQNNGRPVRIYLHWTAGRYGQFFNDYHINVDYDGKIYVSTNDFAEVKSHTWRRNSGAIGISLACAYNANTNNLGSYPPTVAQIDAAAQVVAVLARTLGISVHQDSVMTHAEAASLDGYGAGSGDPETRWDLWFLKNGDPKGSGGKILREMIAHYRESNKLDWVFK